MFYNCEVLPFVNIYFLIPSYVDCIGLAIMSAFGSVAFTVVIPYSLLVSNLLSRGY